MFVTGHLRGEADGDSVRAAREPRSAILPQHPREAEGHPSLSTKATVLNFLSLFVSGNCSILQLANEITLLYQVV